jgi:2-iminobutanoate/2-iminopropanoate deaminase
MDRMSVNSPSVATGGSMYSQAVKAGQVLYISGQVAYDINGQLVGKGDITAQTTQVFDNMKALLQAAGMTFENIVKINIYLTDLENRPAFHTVRSKYFRSNVLPASTLVVVKSLAHPDLLVEVEATAVA